MVGIAPVEEEQCMTVRTAWWGSRIHPRVKMKIRPETALECVAAVRADHPDLTLMLDANQSFDESYLDVLYK